MAAVYKTGSWPFFLASTQAPSGVLPMAWGWPGAAGCGRGSERRAGAGRQCSSARRSGTWTSVMTGDAGRSWSTAAPSAHPHRRPRSHQRGVRLSCLLLSRNSLESETPKQREHGTDRANAQHLVVRGTRLSARLHRADERHLC